MKNATALLIIMTTFMVIHAHPEAVKFPELIVQLGNPSGRPGEIISLAVSPDGKYALAGSRDNSITLYHIPSGNEMRRLTGTGAINTLSFSPDGKCILSGSTSFSNILKKDIPSLVLWDASTGQQIKVFKDFPAGIHALAFSSDGRFMISGGSDYTVKLWEVDPGKKLKQFNGHTGTIRALSFSPDDKFILSGAIGGEVKLWDIETGREIKQYNGFSKNISVVAFTSDGKRVIAGCETGLKSWEISSAEESNIFKKLSHKIPHGGISSNGRFILAESGCGEVTILDTFNEQAKHTIKFSAECNKIKAAAVDPGGANILLYSGNRLYYLDTKTNIEINSIKKYSSQINFSIFSPDGNYILAGSSDNTLKLWDLEKGTQIRELSGHKDKVICGAFSSEGNLAVSGSTDKTVKLWDIHGGQQIKTLEGHSDDIFFVAFSPDGKQVFSASADNTFKVWDARSGKNIKTLKQDYNSIDSAAVSPDGKKALIGTSALSFPLRMVDIKTGKVVKSLNGHYDLVYSISITPDGNYVVTLSKDETAKLWNLNTGNEIKTTHPLAWFFSMTALSPDGSYILTTNKKDILLIETSTGKVIKKLRGHFGFVSSVAFCLNGKYALSGSEDKTVRLWHLKSGKEVECLRNDMGDVVSITVSLNGNGKNALFMNYDQEVQLWDIEKKHRLKCFAETIDDLKYVGFSPDEKYLLWGKNDDTLTLWDIKGKRTLRTFHGRFPTFLSTSNIITPDGKAILLGNGENGVSCLDILNGKQIKRYKEFGSDILSIDIAKHGDLFIAGSSDSINIWDMNSETPANSYNWVAGDGNFINTFAITPCGRYYLIPVPFFGGTMSLWDIEKAQVIKKLWEQKEVASTVTFSQDGKLAVTESGGLLTDSKLRIWDIENTRQVITLSTKSGEALEELDSGKTANPLGIDIPVQDKFYLLMNLAKRLKNINTKELYGNAVWPQSTAISPKGKYVLTGSGANFLGQNFTLKLWDLKNGCLSKTLSGHTNRITAIAFSPDGSKALSADKIGTVCLWDIPSGKLLATLISLNSGNWCALLPDGRYTSNSPGDLEGVSWRMPDSPMIPLPIEIFMREYYEPRLLPRIFSGAVFPPITDIKSLNRIQPDVKIVSIEPVKNHRARLNVTVEVAEKITVTNKNGKEIVRRSGIRDLRLFRNDQWVGYHPQKNGQIILDRNNKKRIIFSDIKIPRQKDVEQVEFSAYAFNDDRVKSKTHFKTFKIPAGLTPVKGNAYLVTVGVNAYENPDWDLQYAANDARIIRETLVEKLRQTGQFENIAAIPLISDYKMEQGNRVITENNATKQNFKAVLDLLAGKKVDPEIIKRIPNAGSIREANPEDLVFISFSSHGQADKKGNFCFFPYDIGSDSDREAPKKNFLNRCISSDELSLWLRDVDAGDMVMIVDACYSAATVEQEGFKPGPMGSRGLGQLAYNKGMYILAASQADDYALEDELLKHGLLTYALVHDGINAGRADFKPKDNRIAIPEWLEYGVERVPKLYEEIRNGRIKSLSKGGKKRSTVYRIEDKNKNFLKKRHPFQQPSLFNFTKSKREITLISLKEK